MHVERAVPRRDVVHRRAVSMTSTVLLVRRALVAALLSTASLGAAACTADPAGGDTGESADEIVATIDGQAIDLKKTTRILLIGDSHELDDLALRSATTKARRYAQLYPQDQVVLFITKEVSSSDLARTGVKTVTKESFGDVKLSDLSALESDKLIAALHEFRRIGSIDFFGHSSPWGALIETQGAARTLGPSTPVNVAVLKDNFARDVSPYVVLHGCNGGVTAAAFLSKAWLVPVAVALTGSNFQTLRSDGRWYFNDEGFYPPSTHEVVANDRSFGPASTPSCNGGACVRMKPQDSPYRGIWANPDSGFQFGLSYYKFFCNYGADPSQTCAKGMARSLHAFASVKPIDATSSEADVNDVLADFFCSSSADPATFDGCRNAFFLASASGAAFSPMKSANDYSLECDFTRCEQKFRCTEVNGEPQYRSCVWVDAGCSDATSAPDCRTKNTKKQTTTRELRSYLDGQRLLHAE
jgi:hypothetical protein